MTSTKKNLKTFLNNIVSIREHVPSLDLYWAILYHMYMLYDIAVPYCSLTFTQNQINVTCATGQFQNFIQ